MRRMKAWIVILGIGGWAGITRGVADEPQTLPRVQEAAAGAKIDLAHAMEVATKAATGGRVLGGGLAWDRRPAPFAISVLVSDRVKEVEIDANNGTVLGIEDESMEANEIAEAGQGLATAKITVPQAVELATRSLKGAKAIDASVAFEGASVRFTVTVLHCERAWVVTVDGDTAEIVATAELPLPLARETFNRDEEGAAPAGWSLRETNPGEKKGVWSVTADPSAPSGGKVLRLAATAAGKTYNVALVEKSALRDLDLRGTVKAETGREDQGGGLIWRCRDANNYYVCRINPLEGNFRVYKVVEGRRQQLQSVDVPTQSGQWYAIRAVMVGDRMVCSLDDEPYLDVRDDTFKEAGMIGLWTKADASSSFDELVVYPPPPRSEAAATQPAPTSRSQGEPGGNG
jgi:hypothetical protein